MPVDALQGTRCRVRVAGYVLQGTQACVVQWVVPCTTVDSRLYYRGALCSVVRYALQGTQGLLQGTQALWFGLVALQGTQGSV